MKSEAAIAQCRANLLALLEHYELPVKQVVATLVDRIFIIPDFGAPRLQALWLERKFDVEGFYKNHGTTAIGSWREACATCSLQLVEHNSGIWEVDADRFNPKFGVAPAVGHLGEIIIPGRTDPYAIREGLLKRGIQVPEIRG